MSIHYAESERSRAFMASLNASNPRATSSAEDRLSRWTEAVQGMIEGSLSVGSRTPIRNIPAFLTPDVLKGGFVSGRLRAGGELLPFELILADRTLPNRFHDAYSLTEPADQASSPIRKSFSRVSELQAARARLNKQFLTRTGISVLSDLLQNRTYKIESAEEAALLTVVWLLERKEDARAGSVVRAIAPYFHLARFYPQPAKAPISVDLKCSRSSVEQVREHLKLLREQGPRNAPMKYCTMKISVEDIAPAYDTLVSLLLATCDYVPRIENVSEGMPCTVDSLSFQLFVMEDNPRMLLPFQKPITSSMRSAFRVIDVRFREIEQRVSELRSARPGMRTLRKLDPKRSNCGFLLSLARTFFEGKDKRGRASIKKVSIRDIQFAQTILIQIYCESRRGLPLAWTEDVELDAVLGRKDTHVGNREGEASSSNNMQSALLPSRLEAYRKRQREATRAEPCYMSVDWIKVILARLDKQNGNEQHGLDDVAPLLEACSEAESALYNLSAGTDLPETGRRCLRFLQRGTIFELVEQGHIPSMEVLATVADSFIGAAKVQNVAGDDSYRALYTSVSHAFRTRRSLLLLNFESQVGFNELPWAAQLERARRTVKVRDVLCKLLLQIVKLCVTKWPHVIIPNKLISALNMIAEDAEIQTPHGKWLGLMPELAADIFMGGFTSRWALHACVAAKQLSGTVYDRYYRGNEEQNGNISIWHEILGPWRADVNISLTELEQLCQKSISTWKIRSSVAANGAYIETAMILTVHNYAYLFEVLESLNDGQDSFSQEELFDIAIRCHEALCVMLAPAVGEDTNMKWYGRLQATKNVAYGWRQLVYIVSKLDRTFAEKFFEETVDRKRAANGCHLQRALIDLRAVWNSLHKPESDTQEERKRPWKSLRGWVEGHHPIWDAAWCMKIKSAMLEGTFVS